MTHLHQLRSYKKHLQERYVKLLEMSCNYRYEDENKSDLAAFKAMKLKEKLNQVSYLDKELSL